MPYSGWTLSSSLRQGCQVSPGVPTTAAAKRCTGALHGLGGDGGEVEQAAAGLGAVDLLQAEHVGVQVGDGRGDPFGVYGAVGQGSAVQQVEGGQAHGSRP